MTSMVVASAASIWGTEVIWTILKAGTRGVQKLQRDPQAVALAIKGRIRKELVRSTGSSQRKTSTLKTTHPKGSCNLPLPTTYHLLLWLAWASTAPSP